MRRCCVLTVFVAVVALVVFSINSPATAAPTTITVMVDGVKRTALVQPGREAATTPSPLVLFFHSLGGSSHEGVDLGIAKAWPEATVVCPQGLKVPTPEAGGGAEYGWQLAPGERSDEDLRFVEALIQSLGTAYQIDERRVYATGFSRGAYFCYLLLAMRPQLFAAFAPVSASALPQLKWARMPRALLATHGKADDTVPFSLAEATRSLVLRLNGCDGEPVPWGASPRSGSLVSVSYPPGATGQPLVWSVHDGGHEWPAQTTANIVQFFKEQALAAAPLAAAPPAAIDTSASMAGTGSPGHSGDGGSAAAAQLFFPEGVALDREGDLFIADTMNQRVRKMGLDGVITTVAGSGKMGLNPSWVRHTADAGRATLLCPEQIVLGPDDSLYIADSYRHLVEKVTSQGAISVVAGRESPVLGSIPLFSGDDGPATQSTLSFPAGLALDPQGNLFIADTENHRVRQVAPDGTITTVAGTGVAGYSGDGGQATAAQLNVPWGLALDRQGNLFIADSANHRVRKLARDGTITTVAGTGEAGLSGDEGQAREAQLNQPLGLAVDSQDNLFIVDSLNYRVRRVAPDGTITSVFGGGAGSDGSPAPRYYPAGVAVDRSGNLLIADPFHHRIWKVAGVAAPGLVAGQPFPAPGDQP